MTVTLKKVLISDPIDPKCVDLLKKHGMEVTALPKAPSPDDLAKQIKGYDGLIVRSGSKVTSAVIEAGAGSLKVIGRAGTGVDNIDVPAATKHGILVMNTPGGNTISAAEHTCAMIMASVRDIGAAAASMKEGKWDRKAFMGEELMNKTLGLVGLGRVGREVAIRMQSFGMKVIGFDPFVSAESAAEDGIELMTLDKMWPLADWISIHTPLLPSTKNLVNGTVFGKCKKGVRVVNVARGGIIDHVALLKALESGQVASAALDVFEEEPPKSPADLNLIKHPKVLATPHLGASTKEAQVRVAEEIAQSFVNMSLSKPLVGLVNGGHLAKAALPQLKPWVALATRLAKVAAKLGDFKTDSKVSVHLAGPNATQAAALAPICVVVGFFNDMKKVNMLTAESAMKPPVTLDAKSEKDYIIVEVNGTKVTGTTEGALPLLTCISSALGHNYKFVPAVPLEEGAVSIFGYGKFQQYCEKDKASVSKIRSVSQSGSWAIVAYEEGFAAPPADFASTITFE